MKAAILTAITFAAVKRRRRWTIQLSCQQRLRAVAIASPPRVAVTQLGDDPLIWNW